MDVCVSAADDADSPTAEETGKLYIYHELRLFYILLHNLLLRRCNLQIVSKRSFSPVQPSRLTGYRVAGR